MARVRIPLLSHDASGQFGKQAIYRKGGIVSKYFKPRNPRSAKQQAHRRDWKSRFVKGQTGIGEDMSAQTGMIVGYAGTVDPDGWLICDGRSLSRATYAALFAVIGTAFGSEDLASFNIPDLRDRVMVGVGNAFDFGVPVGELQHVLTEDEMPTHTHYPAQMSNSGSDATVGTTGRDQDTGFPITIQTPTTSAGGGEAHNNVQPSLGLNYIIRSG